MTQPATPSASAVRARNPDLFVAPSRPRSLLQRVIWFFVRRRIGFVPTPVKLMGESPAVFRSYLAFEALGEPRKLPARLAALANLRTAMLVGCRLCIDIGSQQAKDSGLSHAEIAALVDPKDASYFSALDQNVLQLCEDMSGAEAVQNLALLTSLSEALGSQALIELVQVIAWENFRARFNHTVTGQATIQARSPTSAAS